MVDRNMCVPYVGGIIERKIDGKTEILIQTRWKPEIDSYYSGSIEIAAGALNTPYENIYETLAREIHEETGLILNRIINDSKTEVLSPRDDRVFGFRPYCCTQQLKNGLPWIGFIFRCEVKPGEPKAQVAEVKDVRWVEKSDLRRIFETEPEKIFTLELPAWQYYFSEN